MHVLNFHNQPSPPLDASLAITEGEVLEFLQHEAENLDYYSKLGCRRKKPDETLDGYLAEVDPDGELQKLVMIHIIARGIACLEFMAHSLDARYDHTTLAKLVRHHRVAEAIVDNRVTREPHVDLTMAGLEKENPGIVDRIRQAQREMREIHGPSEEPPRG